MIARRDLATSPPFWRLKHDTSPMEGRTMTFDSAQYKITTRQQREAHAGATR